MEYGFLDWLLANPLTFVVTLGIVVIFLVTLQRLLVSIRLVREMESNTLFDLAGGRKRTDIDSEPSTRKRSRGMTAQRLVEAGIGMNSRSWLLLRAGTPVIALVIATILVGPVLGFICAICIWTAFGLFLTHRKTTRNRRLEEQLAMAEMQIAENHRGGLSVQRSIVSVGRQAGEPLRTHFERLESEITFGNTDLADAFEHMAERTGNEDVVLLANVIRVQQETGSSLSDSLDFLAETISKRLEMRQELKMRLADVSLSRNIVAAAPPVMFVVVLLLFNGYLEFYATEPIGWAVIIFVAICEVIGLCILKRMTQVKLN